MTLVVDASVVTAALVDSGPDGTWAEQRLAQAELIAPHLMLAEVTNILRRAAATGALSQDSAALAFADLLDLRVELYPFAPLAERVWELRDKVTAYDAWYVALAEVYDVPLATLDARLASAPGPICTFVTPH